MDKSVLLAEHGKYRVESCSCGTINIHLGQISLRVSPVTLLTISNVLNSASNNYVDLIAHLQNEQVLPSVITMQNKPSEDQGH